MASAPSSFAFGLHRAAALGNSEGVKCALRLGADVNALDATGRTALMCAIAGDNWRNVDTTDPSFMTSERVASIRLIVNHPKISLLTLNAPHACMKGVVPLGMASWLNLPRIVRLLLEESADTVSVDGMDSHGATALMYAARDGNLEVVQALLSHGARPDFRDSNHRTSIQFSLNHPQILWLCETVLRRHRWREANAAERSPQFPMPEHISQLAIQALPSSDDLEPPPSSIFSKEATSRLLSHLSASICSGDLDFLHSLLFAPALPISSSSTLYPMSVPVLVNLPDSQGWSLLHHAMAVPQPSMEVLDSLYFAGGDTALFTKHEQWTPLHILARFASVPSNPHALRHLVVHLIHDLRAPIAARDRADETCIHIAAEHGHSLELLTFLLECDKSGAAQRIRNSRGLTPSQVARPEFATAFASCDNVLHPPNRSRASSTASYSSFSSLGTLADPVEGRQAPSVHSSVDITLLIHSLITYLRISSPDGRHVNEAHVLKEMETVLNESRQQQPTLVNHFRDRIKEAEEELLSLKKTAEQIGSLRSMVMQAASDKIAANCIEPLPPKLCPRDSQDSQSTAFSQDSGIFLSSPTSPPPRLRVQIGTGTLTRRQPSTPILSSLYESPLEHSPSWSGTEDSPVDPTVEKKARSGRLGMRISTPDLRLTKSNSPKKEKAKEVEHAKRDRTVSGTMRLKAWLKRVVSSSHLSDFAEEDQAPIPLVVPTIQVSTPQELEPCDSAIYSALLTSMVVLDAVDGDLSGIFAALKSAEHFITLANHSIDKAEKAMKRAFKRRQQMITKLRSSKPGTEWNQNELVGPASPSRGLLSPLHIRASIASMSSILTQSSAASAGAATITEHDDDDTRVIRRLLLRKIEAQSSGAWEELEKALSWLRVVKEVVRGVKRRAYL
ncbi:ankyrin repeat-containing domain protein [Coprinopsis sp. MPI-PUGE-AT-0042]|nr:ankyrin repeat-containing domain protein [Coprinopsis sp. MPI-PUGE-AT-0042]